MNKTSRILSVLFALFTLTLTACVAQPSNPATPPPAPVVTAPTLGATDRAALAAHYRQQAESEQWWSDYYATTDGERNYRATCKGVWLAEAVFVETSANAADQETLVATFRQMAASEDWWSENYAYTDGERNYRAWRKQIWLLGAADAAAFKATGK